MPQPEEKEEADQEPQRKRQTGVIADMAQQHQIMSIQDEMQHGQGETQGGKAQERFFARRLRKESGEQEHRCHGNPANVQDHQAVFDIKADACGQQVLHKEEMISQRNDQAAQSQCGVFPVFLEGSAEQEIKEQHHQSAAEHHGVQRKASLIFVDIFRSGNQGMLNETAVMVHIIGILIDDLDFPVFSGVKRQRHVAHLGYSLQRII